MRFSNLLIRVTVAAIATLFFLIGVQAAPNTTYVSVSGTDSGDCSVSACRTVNYALGQTNTGGQIIINQSGDYDSFTITKSVSVIAPDDVKPVIRTPSGQIGVSGIRVAAGAQDSVTLHGLTLMGDNKIHNCGISFESGLSLEIRKCNISTFYRGISSAANGKILIADSACMNAGTGIILESGVNNGIVSAYIHNFLAEGCFDDGLRVNYSSEEHIAVVRNSVFRNCSRTGIRTDTNGAKCTVENCVVANNGLGVGAIYGSIRVSNSIITGNVKGVDGNTVSRGNNTVEDNKSGETFAGNYAAK